MTAYDKRKKGLDGGRTGISEGFFFKRLFSPSSSARRRNILWMSRTEGLGCRGLRDRD